MTDKLPDIKDVKITVVTNLSDVLGSVEKHTLEECEQIWKAHVRHLEPDVGWKGRVEAVVAPELAPSLRYVMDSYGAHVDLEETLPDGRIRLFSEGYWHHIGM